ncbi:MAG: DMT family transporter [Candidatus Edwardsbacteria bacterium]
MTNKPPYLWPVLMAGMVSISFAAIIIKACQAPPLAIAFFRLAISSILLWPVLALKRPLKGICGSDLLWTVIAGVFLSLHFGLWIYSLNYTSVVSSVVFVTVNPLFVGILGWVFLRERVGKRLLLAIVLVLVGGVLIGGRSAFVGGTANFGNLLVLVGLPFSIFSCWPWGPRFWVIALLIVD